MGHGATIKKFILLKKKHKHTHKPHTHTHTHTAAITHANISQATFCSSTLFQILTAFAAVFCEEEEV